MSTHTSTKIIAATAFFSIISVPFPSFGCFITDCPRTTLFIERLNREGSTSRQQLSKYIRAKPIRREIPQTTQDGDQVPMCGVCGPSLDMPTEYQSILDIYRCVSPNLCCSASKGCRTSAVDTQACRTESSRTQLCSNRNAHCRLRDVGDDSKPADRRGECVAHKLCCSYSGLCEANSACSAKRIANHLDVVAQSHLS